MKRFFIFFIIFFTINLYGNSVNLQYLKKLVQNGYDDIAIELCYKNKENYDVKKFLLNLLLLNEQYDKVIEIVNPDSSNTIELSYLTQAYIFANKIGNAEKMLSKLKKIDLKIYNNLINLYKGMIFYQQYDYQKALKYFLNISSPSDKIQKIIAKIYILSGNINKGEKILQKIEHKDNFLSALIEYKSGNFKKAVAILESCQTKNRDIKILLFNSYLKLQKFNKAENILKTFDTSENRAIYKKVEMLFSYGKYEDIEVILSKQNDSYLKFYFLGKIYLKQGEYLDSIRCFKTALKYNSNSKILFLLANSYEKLKCYNKAKDIYKQIVIMADNNLFYSESLFKLGLCYFFIGDFKLAGKYFEKYLTNEEHNSKYLSSASNYLAICYEKTGEFVKAIKIYNNLKDIVQDNKRKKEIDFAIAQLWRKLKKYNFAIDIYTKYVPVKERKDIFILKKLGNLFKKLGNYKSSNLFFQEYLDKKDKFIPEIYLQIGLNFLYMGKIGKAKKYFLEIIENKRTDKFKEEALFYMGKIYYNSKNFKLSMVYFIKLIYLNKFSPLSEQTIEYICYESYKLSDRNTFIKYFKQLGSPQSFIKKFNLSFLEICKFINCSKELVIALPEESRLNYFKTLYSSLKDKKEDYLLSIIENGNYIGADTIIFFYIGEILFNRGLENKGIVAFNKFLNNGYYPIFYREYREALIKLVMFYYIQKDFQKIVSFYPIYSKIEDLPENILYIIGIANSKFNLTESAKKFLVKFIKISKQGEKLFNASFALDKLNFLDEAEAGYKKSLKYLKKSSLKIEACYWIGEINSKNKNYIEALNYFLKIKLIFPFDNKWTPTASFRIASIYEEMGKRDKALKEYKFIMDKLPASDPRKRFVINKVKKLEKE